MNYGVPLEGMIQNRLNHRPRKVLGYKTPYEVFFSEMSRKYLVMEVVE
ncbi:MAG: hypothetical protein COA39_009395 [Sulfurimonas sp.]|nr:hypothetical protein [Sulfurimonas sp.]